MPHARTESLFFFKLLPIFLLRTLDGATNMAASVPAAPLLPSRARLPAARQARHVLVRCTACTKH